MKQGRTQFIILGLLMHRPLSGYQIKKLINQSVSHFWSESFGQIYPTLHDLNAKKWISIVAKTPKNKRENITYSINPKGKIAYLKWLHSSTFSYSIRNEFLLKLFFAKDIPTSQLQRILSNYQSLIQEQLNQIKLIATRYINITDTNSYHYFEKFTIDFGLQMLDAQLKWSHGVLKKINTNQKGDFYENTNEIH